MQECLSHLGKSCDLKSFPDVFVLINDKILNPVGANSSIPGCVEGEEMSTGNWLKVPIFSCSASLADGHVASSMTTVCDSSTGGSRMGGRDSKHGV